MIKVSCVQFSYKPIEIFEDFAKNIEILLKETKGSDFVVFPETFTLELQYLIPNNDIRKVPKFTNKYIDLFKELSKKMTISSLLVHI